MDIQTTATSRVLILDKEQSTEIGNLRVLGRLLGTKGRELFSEFENKKL